MSKYSYFRYFVFGEKRPNTINQTINPIKLKKFLTKFNKTKEIIM